jgi:hypothetical protein
MRIGTFAYLVTGPPHTYFYATYTRTGTAAEVAVSVPYSVVPYEYEVPGLVAALPIYHVGRGAGLDSYPSD